MFKCLSTADQAQGSDVESKEGVVEWVEDVESKGRWSRNLRGLSRGGSGITLGRLLRVLPLPFHWTSVTREQDSGHGNGQSTTVYIGARRVRGRFRTAKGHHSEVHKTNATQVMYSWKRHDQYGIHRPQLRRRSYVSSVAATHIEPSKCFNKSNIMHQAYRDLPVHKRNELRLTKSSAKNGFFNRQWLTSMFVNITERRGTLNVVNSSDDYHESLVVRSFEVIM